LVAPFFACRGLSYILPMLKGISQHCLLLLCEKLLVLCKSRTKMSRVFFRAQVAWIPRLLFFCVVPTSIISGFFSPLTLIHCFFLPLGCWVAFGLVDFTVCTSDVWVGGAAKAIVWLAAVCCMDNCCNYFFNCSAGLVCAEPTMPSACGPTLYLVLSSIKCGASEKMLYNKLD
jgi:hypothetical protein